MRSFFCLGNFQQIRWPKMRSVSLRNSNFCLRTSPDGPNNFWKHLKITYLFLCPYLKVDNKALVIIIHVSRFHKSHSWFMECLCFGQSPPYTWIVHSPVISPLPLLFWNRRPLLQLAFCRKWYCLFTSGGNFTQFTCGRRRELSSTRVAAFCAV